MNGSLLLAALAATLAGAAHASAFVALSNPYVRLKIQGAGIAELKPDPAGRSRWGASFAMSLRPDNWAETPETRVVRDADGVTLSPLTILRDQPVEVDQGGADAVAERLETGGSLAQTFQIAPGMTFDAVSILIPTWQEKTSGATLSLFRGETEIAREVLKNVPDNSWQALHLPAPQGKGSYVLRLSDPVGMIGWWSRKSDAYPDGEALTGDSPKGYDRAFRANAKAAAGTGSLRFSLNGSDLRVRAEMKPTGAAPSELAFTWRSSWTKAGYDCTPRAGVLFSRFFADNQRYMPVQQLKRRDDPGLSFDGCRWIEMDGNQDADFRVEGKNLRLRWEMEPRALNLRFAAALTKKGESRVADWTIRVLPRKDRVPPLFPRFVVSDKAMEEDLNRFLWDRAFSYPAPAGNAAWFEWMSLMRAWYSGPERDGEMKHLIRYPITPEGYVHTWDGTIGWPFPDSPPYDTRHFDTNARFILACRRYSLWTGDKAFLRSQADRLRRAMRYQLETLHGKDGLIVTASANVTGKHKGIGDNYWDILPFGHLDAYANAVFYASLEAMKEIDEVTGAPSLTDYDALRKKAHRAYDETFWDEGKGRFIGAVDIDGGRHDYGFTFVNLEALYYGLGDAAKAKRIYHWIETEPTSTGKADAYSKFIFAPRANTIHDPMWGENAPAKEKESATPPWWMFGWTGTPYGEQCQDGGAILYTSYFDLMDRVRAFGPENAWKRFGEIMARYRMPDRLCGGAPLYRGEIPQQENPGAVGVDLPFPESGLVPCYFLYGVLGIRETPKGLLIRPRLPEGVRYAGAKSLDWRGRKLEIVATRKTVRVTETKPDGKSVAKTFPVAPSGVLYP